MQPTATDRVIVWDAQHEQRFLDRVVNATSQQSVGLFLALQVPPLSPHPTLLAKLNQLCPTFLSRVVAGLSRSDDPQDAAHLDLALAQLTPPGEAGQASLQRAMATLCNDYSAEQSHWVFERLLRAGVSPYEPLCNAESPSAFMAQCGAPNGLSTVRWLFDHHRADEHLETMLPNGHTPLSFAVGQGCVASACFLIEQGADPHRQSVFGGPSDYFSGLDPVMQSPMEFIARRRKQDLPALEEALARARQARHEAVPMPATTRPRRRS